MTDPIPHRNVTIMRVKYTILEPDNLILDLTYASLIHSFLSFVICDLLDKIVHTNIVYFI